MAAEKMTLDGLNKILARLPPVQPEPDSLYMTETMRDRIGEALQPLLVAKSETHGFRLHGMDILSYPAGTIILNTKTGERVTIQADTVISAFRSDVVVIDPRLAPQGSSNGE